MTEFTAQYWKSDEVSPSEFKDNIYRNFVSAIQNAFTRNDGIRFDAERNCIDISFDCDKLNINLRDEEKEMFVDIFNDEYTIDGKVYATSFIYHQFLNSIIDVSRDDINSLSRNVTSDIIWRIARYIGAGDKLYNTNTNSTDDSVWEVIHNE
tara:strand:+ start:176 stop:631 length:456 start_codon:yes stop_codon:yes gene_type:complete